MFATRPVQEMSNTYSALRAAREVQADTLAPELYRQAKEMYFKASHEYKFKNFAQAREYCDKARLYAEQAEFESLRNGGNRTDQAIPDPLGNGAEASAAAQNAAPPSSTPYEYPKPQSTPADVYDQRKQAEEKSAAPAPVPAPNSK